jgi:putative nucleotidyltransferase with HDIG domain
MTAGCQKCYFCLKGKNKYSPEEGDLMNTLTQGKLEQLTTPLFADSINSLWNHNKKKLVVNLLMALKKKDDYTFEHSLRVTRIAVQIAKRLWFSSVEMEIIYNAGILHDIGKLAVSRRILKKRGQLNQKEWETIYQHSQISEMIVRQFPTLAASLPAIRNHHERYDGNGYPDKLQGRAIPLHARIIAVADAFDAMTSTRPYRTAMSISDALSVIGDESGAQFDPFVVEVFMDVCK